MGALTNIENRILKQPDPELLPIGHTNICAVWGSNPGHRSTSSQSLSSWANRAAKLRYIHSQFALMAQGGPEGRVRLLLTKNPAVSFSYLNCQVHGNSFEWFPRPWQTVRHWAPSIMLTSPQGASGIQCAVDTGSDQTASNQLLAIRKPAPTVTPYTNF